MSRLFYYYRFHDPQTAPVCLLFELLGEYYVFARQEVSGRQEVIFARLLFIILFVETSFVFLQVFVKHVLPTQLVPPSKVIDLHRGQYPVPFKNPVHLLFLAPHHVPIITISLLPLSTHQTRIHAIFECCFEFYIIRLDWIMLLLYISPEIFRHCSI